MIKVDELRLGNFVMDLNCRESIVRELHFKGGLQLCPIGEDYSKVDNFESINPIPLTEEWLVKLGFVDYGERTFKKIYADEYLEVEPLYGSSFWLLNKYETPTYNKVRLRGIENVHQLQNLYLELTGVHLILTKKSWQN